MSFHVYTVCENTSRPQYTGMLSQNFGHIVNISSIWGKSGAPLRGTYAPSKFALHGLTESLKWEVKSTMLLCLVLPLLLSLISSPSLPHSPPSSLPPSLPFIPLPLPSSSPSHSLTHVQCIIYLYSYTVQYCSFTAKMHTCIYTDIYWCLSMPLSPFSSMTRTSTSPSSALDLSTHQWTGML